MTFACVVCVKGRSLLRLGPLHLGACVKENQPEPYKGDVQRVRKVSWKEERFHLLYNDSLFTFSKSFSLISEIWHNLMKAPITSHQAKVSNKKDQHTKQRRISVPAPKNLQKKQIFLHDICPHPGATKSRMLALKVCQLKSWSSIFIS